MWRCDRPGRRCRGDGADSLELRTRSTSRGRARAGADDGRLCEAVAAATAGSPNTRARSSPSWYWNPPSTICWWRTSPSPRTGRVQGSAQRLLDLAEQQADCLGLPEVRLYTNESMTENLAFYSRRGYRETHRATRRRLPPRVLKQIGHSVTHRHTAKSLIMFRESKSDDPQLKPGRN